MATRTSVGTGAWSAAGTWDTGVPGDGDTVVIASEHVVTFDVDQSAFTTGVDITITGTLNHALTGGPYTLFLKTGASVVGAGIWNVGTSANPIPFAVKHTITGAAGWYVDGNSGLTMTVYGAEPTYTYIKLSGAEAAGQTELSVDTDVTGDIWAVGDIIRIDNINKNSNSEERVIAAAGIAAGAITVTAGLTGSKITGSIVTLITRNVKIIAAGTPTRTIYRVGSTENKLTIGGGMWYGVNKYMIESSKYVAISGGTFSASQRSLVSCDLFTITGGCFSYHSQYPVQTSNGTISGGLFSGSNSAISNCGNISVSGGLFAGNGKAYEGFTGTNLIVSGGTFLGNQYGIYSAYNPTVYDATFDGNQYGIVAENVSIDNCTFQNGTFGIYRSTFKASNCTFINHTQDIWTSAGLMYNCTLSSGIEYHLDTNYFFLNNCQSINHDGNDGAFKAWCKGGSVTSQTATKPDDYVQAYIHLLESADYPAYWYKSFSVEPGKTVSVEVQLRKDASMAYLPRVYLMANISNPLLGVTPIDTFTMTDSTNTWETDTFGVTNSTNYDQEYTLWFVAKNATGNAYSAYEITTEGGAGGGSVKILPYSGKVGL